MHVCGRARMCLPLTLQAPSVFCDETGDWVTSSPCLGCVLEQVGIIQTVVEIGSFHDSDGRIKVPTSLLSSLIHLD